MATRRYSIARGKTTQGQDVITEAVGAATATSSMEFTFDLAASLTKKDVLMGLERIKTYILRDTFPPA